MTAIICYKQNSLTLQTTQTASEAQMVFTAKGYESIFAAETAIYHSPVVPEYLVSNAGRTMGLLELNTVELGDKFDHQGGDSGAGEGQFVYEVTVTYSTRAREIGGEHWQISHPVDQLSLTESLETIFPPRPGNWPGNLKWNNVLNAKLTSDGWEADGIDIPPAGDFSMTLERAYPAGTITLEFLADIIRYRFTVNNTPFRGYAIGEVCFRGAEIRNELSESIDVVAWQFEVTHNGFVDSNGDRIFGNSGDVFKYGWDLVQKAIVPTVIERNHRLYSFDFTIERIMPFVDWTLFEIRLNSG